MSRHSIPARDPSLSIVVGWDNPLVTFFAQVVRAEDPDRAEDDLIILWVGTEPREVITVEDLARHLAPYAELPVDVADQLRRDRAAKLGQAPTAIQQAALAAIRTPR
jgi:hypothetical protein